MAKKSENSKASTPSTRRRPMTKANKKKQVKEAPIKILFCSPEVSPFSGTGGLGEVAGSLPAALNKLKNKPIDCRVISPLYGSISDAYRKEMEFLGYTMIPVAWRSKYMGVFRLEKDGTTYYFIDNEEYFKRDAIYGYFDDCERFAFFSRAVFEALPFMDFAPDIMHANDWQTALVPIYQDAIYHREFMSTIFTIHNVEYQGRYGREVISDVIGLPEGAEHLVEYHGDCNLMKGGIDTANLVSTVSPSYAQELKEPFYAFGLDPLIVEKQGKLRGILNGIDVVGYNPAKDALIPASYSSDDLAGKKECKRALQEKLGLPQRDVPLLSIVSRLVPAKGMDLLATILDRILSEEDIQLVALGTGMAEYEFFFRGLEQRFPDKMRAQMFFDSKFSHEIYAGSDIFLMPSRSEPCGLAQMIAMRYGTVPVVRATGGLRDSVQDCTLGSGTGFLFERYNSDDLDAAIRNALSRYVTTSDWEKLVKYDMEQDFSWNASASRYLEMYREAKIK